MSDRIILGINDNHNASACLLKNGKLIACIQEERLTRKKNQGGLPRLAIKKCMEITNTSADDIDLAVFGLKNMPANLEKIQSKKKDRRVTVMLISGASRVLPPFEKALPEQEIQRVF
jgi:predicted NodU family carbamoyl transferase